MQWLPDFSKFPLETIIILLSPDFTSRSLLPNLLPPLPSCNYCAPKVVAEATGESEITEEKGPWPGPQESRPCPLVKEEEPNNRGGKKLRRAVPWDGQCHRDQRRRAF